MRTNIFLLFLLIPRIDTISQEVFRWSIQKSNWETGFIDSLGKEVFKDRFDILFDEYNSGLVFFKKGDKQGYLDEYGNVVISSEKLWGPFSEGLLNVKDDNQFYYLNTKGVIAIDLKNLDIPEGKELSANYNFCNGLAIVIIQNIGHKSDTSWTDEFFEGNSYPGDWYYGFINKHGKWVVKPNLDYATSFKDGISIVHKNGKEYFMDTLGAVITQLDKGAIYFSEGFAIESDGDKWFFINKRGEKINKTGFDNAYNFSDGMACIEVDDKFGFIDTTGTIVIEPRYSIFSDFSEGLAPVTLDIAEKGYMFGHYSISGFIDKKGNIKIPFEKEVDFAGFVNGLSKGRRFIYTEDKKYTGYYELFYINRKGVKVWSEIVKQNKTGVKTWIEIMEQNQ